MQKKMVNTSGGSFGVKAEANPQTVIPGYKIKQQYLDMIKPFNQSIMEMGRNYSLKKTAMSKDLAS